MLCKIFISMTKWTNVFQKEKQFSVFFFFLSFYSDRNGKLFAIFRICWKWKKKQQHTNMKNFNSHGWYCIANWEFFEIQSCFRIRHSFLLMWSFKAHTNFDFISIFLIFLFSYAFLSLSFSGLFAYFLNMFYALLASSTDTL